jgi:hypothetical protein
MTTGKNRDIQPFKIDGEDINRVEQYKYLGVQINDKLNLDTQWMHVSSNFNSTIYLLKTMRQIGYNKKVLASVYKSLISSQIVSNATILCSASEQAKKEMQTMQKRALRAMNINDYQFK